VSVPVDGTSQFPGSTFAKISPDGRYVAFESSSSNLVGGDTNGVQDVFLRDLRTGVTRLASVPAQGAVADDHSYRPSP
jgi:Tol biopolymer transport system component